MIDYSIGELSALVLKAYRGAGQSWGMAQEAGMAVSRLSASGLHSAGPVAQLLPLIDGCPALSLSPVHRTRDVWRGDTDYLCPVVTGSALSDFGVDSLVIDQPLLLQNVLQPVLLLPFVSQGRDTITLSFNGHEYLCAAGAIRAVQQSDTHREDASIAHSVRIESDTRSLHPRATCSRALIDEADERRLLEYAHRTYVPATEASRIAGAGAGLLDND